MLSLTRAADYSAIGPGEPLGEAPRQRGLTSFPRVGALGPQALGAFTSTFIVSEGDGAEPASLPGS